MSATKYRLIFVQAIVFSAVGGCEFTKVDCDETPDAAVCQDDEDIDAGGLFEDDADIDGSHDGGRSDASADGGGSDGGVDGGSDARVDGAQSDATTAPLTVDEFCIAQISVAVAWRDFLEANCTGNTAEQTAFLQDVFGYVDDAEGKCITGRKAAIDSGNSTYDGSKAQACADAYNADLALPPASFPSAGIDSAMYEATIGHGAPFPIQIPACRATFKGKLSRGQRCSDHFECLDGLRCLDAAGNTKSCEPAISGGTCTVSSQCADGYTCVGSPTTGGGKTCVSNSALPLSGGNCEVSRECATDLVCNSSYKCANPVAAVICKP
jgi:hypothetical protein